MHTVAKPVSIGLILVCDKCGKRMQSDRDANPSRQLVARLKKMSRDVFERGEIRVVLTSCLDICPRDRLSVAIIPVDIPAATPHFFAVRADDIGGTSHKILKAARNSSRK